MEHNNKKKFLNGNLIAIIVFILLAVLFYFGEGEQLFSKQAENPLSRLDGDTVSSEITKDFSVDFYFAPNMDVVDRFCLKFATWGREDYGTIRIEIVNETTGKSVIVKELQGSDLKDGEVLVIDLQDGVLENVKNDELHIAISSCDAENGNSVAPWINSKGELENARLIYNGEEVAGTLCFECIGRDYTIIGYYYWQVVGVLFLVLILFLGFSYWKYRKGKKTLVYTTAAAFSQYGFLMKQLISRDFKTKYKKSVLGVLWSFISPLLMMTIQYIVFSTIFTNNIKCYPVYLLSGYTIFNFFSEAVNLGIESIVGNASLITKVYVPKYVYPFTRVCSSAINLFISMILLIVMCIIMRIPFTKALLLIWIPILCIFVFSLGIAMLLSSLMVFFRDIKFLWGALSLVWMYATPIFYPTDIIPEKFDFILKLNPITCILQAFRTILIDGQGVETSVIALSVVYSLLALAVGMLVFKKTQDKFIFNI